jgi:hypothetical protein
MLDIAFVLCAIVGMIALVIPQTSVAQDYSAESFDTLAREE